MVIKNILILEDDFIIQLYLSELLKNRGFVVTGEVTNFNDAIKSIDKSQPDLVLIDIGLAGKIDGIETAHHINRHYKIPFIFTTGNSDVKTLERAFKTNPLDIVIKPIDETTLFKVIEFASVKM
jgi:two-component system, response regulator PdtaR